MTITHPRPPGEAATRDAAAEALGRARDHLLGLQHGQGWWQGELESNVTMDAEDLMLREFLGIRTAEQTQAAARWIASKQRDDGTWANFYGGPGDLSTTVEAYVALRLAGHLPHTRHMAKAAGWIRDQGGIPATRVFTRIWLALFGQWSWDDLPVMPPELIYLPGWFPLNVYDWACWARQTIVPLTIVGTFRPARQFPFGLTELWPDGQAGKPRARPESRATPGRQPSTAWTGCCTPTSAGPTGPYRSGRYAARPCGGAPSGSSRGRSGTAAGAASSRHGCTR